MNQNIKLNIISAVVGALIGRGTILLFQRFQEPSEAELIKEFYLVENAVHVSPHGLRRRMDKGDQNYVLVDLRSQQEYEREHIIGAVNIPAYSDPNTPAYEEKERIVGQFRELIEQNPGKEIITYCYSIPCMTGRKIGKVLAENGIYVKNLSLAGTSGDIFGRFGITNTNGKQPSLKIIFGKEKSLYCAIGWRVLISTNNQTYD